MKVIALWWGSMFCGYLAGRDPDPKGLTLLVIIALGLVMGYLAAELDQ